MDEMSMEYGQLHNKEQRAWSRESLNGQKRVPLKQVDEQSHENSQQGIRRKSWGHVRL